MLSGDQCSEPQGFLTTSLPCFLKVHLEMLEAFASVQGEVGGGGGEGSTELDRDTRHQNLLTGPGGSK